MWNVAYNIDNSHSTLFSFSLISHFRWEDYFLRCVHLSGAHKFTKWTYIDTNNAEQYLRFSQIWRLVGNIDTFYTLYNLHISQVQQINILTSSKNWHKASFLMLTTYEYMWVTDTL